MEYSAEKYFIKARKQAKKSSVYKKLKRNYCISKEYVQYNQIVYDLVLNSMLRMDSNGLLFPPDRLRTKYEAFFFTEILSLNEPSVYCLDSKLLKAIQYTDLPDSMPGLKQSVPFGILLLPEEIIEKGERCGVKYIVFTDYAFDNPLPLRPTRKNYSTEEECFRDIRWYAATSDGQIDYCNKLQIESDGRVVSKHKSLGFTNPFFDQITSILLQSLYFIQSGYRLQENFADIVSTDRRKIKSKGFTKQPSNQIVKYPKYLGRESRIPKSGRVQTVAYPISRSSPTPHIRRGHHRIVKFGENREFAKTVWIPSCYVGYKNR